jgi:hypothetical protein
VIATDQIYVWVVASVSLTLATLANVHIDRTKQSLVLIGGYGMWLLYLKTFPSGRIIDSGNRVGEKIRRKVTLYTKPGCHLCDEAKDEIEGSGSRDFGLIEINIAGDMDLYEQYKYDIPVVLIDDVEAFRHRLTAAEFLRALNQNRWVFDSGELSGHKHNVWAFW